MIAVSTISHLQHACPKWHNRHPPNTPATLRANHPDDTIEVFSRRLLKFTPASHLLDTSQYSQTQSCATALQDFTRHRLSKAEHCSLKMQGGKAPGSGKERLITSKRSLPTLLCCALRKIRERRHWQGTRQGALLSEAIPGRASPCTAPTMRSGRIYLLATRHSSTLQVPSEKAVATRPAFLYKQSWIRRNPFQPQRLSATGSVVRVHVNAHARVQAARRADPARGINAPRGERASSAAERPSSDCSPAAAAAPAPSGPRGSANSGSLLPPIGRLGGALSLRLLAQPFLSPPRDVRKAPSVAALHVGGRDEWLKRSPGGLWTELPTPGECLLGGGRREAAGNRPADHYQQEPAPLLRTRSCRGSPTSTKAERAPRCGRKGRRPRRDARDWRTGLCFGGREALERLERNGPFIPPLRPSQASSGARRGREHGLHLGEPRLFSCSPLQARLLRANAAQSQAWRILSVESASWL